ncbi:tyrosine recombinase XerC [Clostridiales bacterium]|nr:tyrosine recombinase XerC [Clostridiales bacterium]
MIPEQMKIAVSEFRDKRKGLDRDIWKISELKIPEERINKSASLNSFNFYNIKNIHNRELVKIWFKYLIGSTEFAIAYLINSLSIITRFCNFLGEIRIEDTDRILILNYLDTLKDLKIYTYNRITNCISDFYKYLAIKETYKNETPILRTDFKQRESEHHFNSVSEYVILQIFRHLYELPFDLKLMYLINYSTGLRVSDLCQLETDCLLKSEKCYFIRFHIQKMQKDHAVPISAALGELIEKRVQELFKLEYKEKYLFPSKPNEPFKARKYRNDMKKWCKKWSIKNEDGTPYNFLPHSYRHTIASDLTQEYNVDLEIIQLVILGHANPSMSLCYIDETDEYKKMLNDKYVDKSG